VVLVLMPVHVWANGAVVQNNVSDLRVLDANGKRLGIVVGATTGGVTVALRINGRGVLLGVQFAQAFPERGGTRQPIAVGNGDVLLYTSTDCSGTPMLTSDPSYLVPAATIAAPGMTVWMADTTATPQPLVWHSYLDLGLCTAFTLPSNIVSPPLVPAIPLVNLLDHFTPPFRIKFKTAP
jgi:hypothetical protein